MIDFVKIELPPKYKSILEANPLFQPEGTHTVKTGEIGYRTEAQYLKLKFIIYDTGYILIQGSLHYYYNQGNHNYNDFTFDDFVEVMRDLEKKFAIIPKDCIIRNIEFGVNVVLPINTSNMIDFILTHGKMKFKDVALRNKKGICKQAIYSQYLVKVYDKATQFELEKRILRFELSYKKMQKLNRMGIRTAQDLLNKSWIYSISSILNKAWEDIVFYDETIDTSKLKPILKQKCLCWSNANFWSKLTKQAKYRELKVYSECVSKYSKNIKFQMSDLIKDKWEELAGADR